MSNESAISAEKLYEEANELLLNDEYENAINIFTNAIEKLDKSSPFLYNCYIGRSQAYIKLNNYKNALNDSQAALDLNQNDSRGFLKKGIALFNLKEYNDALNALKSGQSKAESDSKKGLFNEWINKCQKELPTPLAAAAVASTPAQIQESTKDNKVETCATSSTEAQTPVPPPPIKYKHEWYQTESSVNISILVKNLNPKDVTITYDKNKLTIHSNDQENLKLNFDFNLANEIQPNETKIKYLANKIEINLKKCEAIQWRKLESESTSISVKSTGVAAAAATASAGLEKKPEYPTSSKKPKNWDKIASDIAAEEKDEKLEGDAALNKLFQQIYSNGSDEVRKAMNKSFSESGGTVLSTNWQDVGAKKLEVKAPDGMEWKKWDD